MKIIKKYDTITINECNTSKKCCECNNDLSYYRHSNGNKQFRLLVCSGCVRPPSQTNRIQDKRR
jgi:hypothetical protein